MVAWRNNRTGLVRMPDNAVFTVSTTMSGVAWVKGAAGQVDIQYFAQWDSTANQRSWFMATDPVNGTRLGILLSNAGTFGASTVKWYYGSTTVFDGNWHMVAFTWNSGTLKLFVDGVEETSVTQYYNGSFTSLFNSTADVTIGARLAGGSTFGNFNGTVGQCALFNTVLTPTQIANLYSLATQAPSGGGGGDPVTQRRDHNYLNQITRIIEDSEQTALVYDKNGNLLDDGTRLLAYDALNRLIEVKRKSDSAVVGQYTYDAQGRRIRKVITNGGIAGSITNGTADFLYLPGGWQCCEERNASNQPTRHYVWGIYIDELIQQRNNPGGSAGTQADRYLLSGFLYNATALTDASGAIVETYDLDPYGNRLIFTTSGGGGNWWADNATPISLSVTTRLARVELPNGTAVAYTYDAFGRTESVTSYATPAELAVDNGFTTSYTYYDDGLLHTVTDPNAGVTTYTYDAAGRLQTRLLPNGIQTIWTFDTRDRLLSLVHEDTNTSTVVESFTYWYTADGSVDPNTTSEPRRITRANGSYVELDYDDALRVQEESWYDTTANGNVLLETITYTYDSAGNRTAVSNGAGDFGYNAETASTYLLDTVTDDTQTVVQDLAHDAAGRLTDLTRGGDDWDLTHNAAGQVTGVAGVSGGDLAYTYDGQGQRIGRAQAGGNSIAYAVAPAVQNLGLDLGLRYLAAESTGAGADVSAWVYAGENPIAVRNPDGTMSYYLEDATDSVAALTDASGAATATYAYDAFGNLRPGSADPAATGGLGYHGAWHDPDTGLIDMRARAYDPITGRFTSPDPAEPNPQAPETYHPYVFANNNPHLYSDPTGTFSLIEINITQAIETGIQGIKQAAIQYVKSRIKEEVKAAAARLLGSAFKSLLPVPQGLIEIAQKGLAGASFESLVSNALCGYFGQVLPESILKQFHFGPAISVDGEPLSDGIGCQQGIDAIPSGGTYPGKFANPDFVVREEPPTQGSGRAWLVGDIKLTVNTLYRDYVDPGKKKNQWNAMANYAKNHAYRIVLFIAFKKVNEKGHQLFEEKLLKEGAGSGVIVLVASADF